jgi:hypothetical protein
MGDPYEPVLPIAEDELAAAKLAEERWIAGLRMEQAAGLVPELLTAAKEYSGGLDAAVAGARRVKQLLGEIGELVMDRFPFQPLRLYYPPKGGEAAERVRRIFEAANDNYAGKSGS